MNRGSANPLRSQRRGETRFNEAPIHESGKSEQPVERAANVVASMRPRFMNRGSDPGV